MKNIERGLNDKSQSLWPTFSDKNTFVVLLNIHVESIAVGNIITNDYS